MVTREILEKEFNKIPIRVIEGSTRDLKKLLKGRQAPLINVNEWLGCYMYAGVQSSLIFIQNNIPNFKKLWVFFHEKGHYLCDEKDCDCCYRVGSESELHANLYALDQCYKNNYFLSLESLVKEIWKSTSEHNLKIVKSYKWIKYVNAVSEIDRLWFNKLLYKGIKL